MLIWMLLDALQSDVVSDSGLQADTGDTPLILASSQGHLGVTKLLLEHAADPNLAATDDGGNPILYAAQEVSFVVDPPSPCFWSLCVISPHRVPCCFRFQPETKKKKTRALLTPRRR